MAGLPTSRNRTEQSLSTRERSAPPLNTNGGPMTPLPPPTQYRLPQRTISIASRSNIRLLSFAPKVSAERRNGDEAAIPQKHADPRHSGGAWCG